jgi:hypothetical protein
MIGHHDRILSRAKDRRPSLAHHRHSGTAPKFVNEEASQVSEVAQSQEPSVSTILVTDRERSRTTSSHPTGRANESGETSVASDDQDLRRVPSEDLYLPVGKELGRVKECPGLKEFSSHTQVLQDKEPRTKIQQISGIGADPHMVGMQRP